MIMTLHVGDLRARCSKKLFEALSKAVWMFDGILKIPTDIINCVLKHSSLTAEGCIISIVWIATLLVEVQCKLYGDN